MNIANDYSIYIIYDDPVPYRGLLLYPVKMRQYLQFLTVARILLLDKNSIPDVKIISMSYLEYVYSSSTDENLYMTLLDALLRMVFHIDYSDEIKYFMDEDGKPYFLIGETRFDSMDFDNIREIVAEQNVLNIPDDKVQKSIRDSIEEAERLRRKAGGNKVAGIEDQMIALSTATGMPLNDIYELTIRKFSKMIERVDLIMHYKIYTAASLSGFVKFKDKSAIKHWLSDPSRDNLANMIEYDEFEQSVSGAVGTQ